jgi:hypothetical protein
MQSGCSRWNPGYSNPPTGVENRERAMSSKYEHDKSNDLYGTGNWLNERRITSRNAFRPDGVARGDPAARQIHRGPGMRLPEGGGHGTGEFPRGPTTM